MLLLIFCIGYFFIATEHKIGINKAATALCTAALCWLYVILHNNTNFVLDSLRMSMANHAEVLFFLLGAMTIVEVLDANNCFDRIANSIRSKKTVAVLWTICTVTFFLSAVLDNLTTTIVMLSITRKIISSPKLKIYFIGLIIIAANAGGAWSVLGDVTTTMLWTNNNISAFQIISSTLLPSLICYALPTAIVSLMIKEKTILCNPNDIKFKQSLLQDFILILGMACIIMVPLFHTITHLPPYLGMLFALSIMWIATEILQKKTKSDTTQLSVNSALQRIDTPSILFFFGILLTISALHIDGVLDSIFDASGTLFSHEESFVFSLGLMSSVIDNVPLVAACQNMFTWLKDDQLWHFLAYCAGTGGSILIIGSAAGVAAMGLEKINFIEYLKKISWLAVVGYIAGAVVFILMN
jgi:Na+/H+ antiporter NhaD/arsenite permease-like protein